MIELKRFSLPKNLSRTDLALVFLALLLVISVYAQIEWPSIFHPVYDLYATKLDEKPQKYFVLDNPDPYVLEAVLNPGRYVSINSPDDTLIDENEHTYGTNNVEFNNSYYEVNLLHGDRFPPPGSYLLILASLVFSATSILIICLFKIAQHLKK